ncbi:hypothetical protein JJB07_09740 [Tumebacillus sp. ITR2]|uniref:Uncharacterized protein n=1 Tax=Tumebacillus amylolyticus TaxID=2801339 RepID=A0ABS1J9H9_9BACL|nr:hypothetical protein [Tumebacillus amylolyticus]MBL0386935.1 hypothetical protein [Tumebacillus amylolyticus]
MDLTLTLEYIWDTQPKRLNVSFQNCWQADFQRNVSLLNHVSEPLDPANSWSWYTIVSFRAHYEGSFHLGTRELPIARVQIFTTDFESPWLTISCQEVLVEELQIT